MTYRAILTASDGAIVGTLSSDDPAEELPAVAFDQLSLVSVSVPAYDGLGALMEPDGWHRWRWRNSVVQARPRGAVFGLLVRDGVVRRAAVATTAAALVAPEGSTVKVVDEETYSLVRDTLRHGGDGPYAWGVDQAGDLIQISDPRPVLFVTHSGQATVGVPTQIDFEVRNAAGNPVNVTQTRTVLVRRVLRVNGQESDVETLRVNLPIVNGTRSSTRTIQAAGRYEFASADPMVYRVAGQTVIEVAEAW